ncbi:MAG TPA: (Fe-S)-binding protein [Dehalococcoidales bacterium]|nr:(Fe-S)-binding protein [Dehalococcoidales bacterium]
MSPVNTTYFGISGYLIFWVLFAIALGFFIYQMVFLIRLLYLGREVRRFNRPWRRMINTLGEVILQRCSLRSVSKRDLAGIGHALMFWGFGLFVPGYFIFIGLSAGFGLYSHLDGSRLETVYYSILDIAGVCVIAAIIWASLRRYLIRPERLKASPEAGVILGLVFTLMLTYFIAEGFGYASGDIPQFWPPVSTQLARAIESSDMSQEAMETAYRVAWWVHYGVILGFGVYIPRSKHLHILASPFNLLFKSEAPRGTLDMPNIGEMEEVGASQVSGFNRKQLLDLYSCTECGRCHEICPARQSGKQLSPMEQVLNLKHHLISEGAGLLKNSSPGRSFFDETVSEDEIWQCVTCRACQEVCPSNIEHVGRIIDLRRNLTLMKACFPAKIKQFYKNIEENSNPWGKAWVYRYNWALGLNIPALTAKSSFDTIYWAGCLGAYHERPQRTAISLSRILKAADISFAVLGNEEKCCGDAVRRTGNEYLFQQLARQNISTFRKYHVKKIITPCPHCYNVFKNEYPHFGGQYEVVHHTQLIADLIRRGTIPVPEKSLNKSLVYHDPCYLGRYNDIYLDPRQILHSIPGLKLAENNFRTDNSHCCGAGGGGMWMTETGERRISQILFDQVTEKKPEILATACPYCLTMLEDESREKGLQNSLAVMDIVEILQSALPQKTW